MMQKKESLNLQGKDSTISKELSSLLKDLEGNTIESKAKSDSYKQQGKHSMKNSPRKTCPKAKKPQPKRSHSKVTTQSKPKDNKPLYIPKSKA